MKKLLIDKDKTDSPIVDKIHFRLKDKFLAILKGISLLQLLPILFFYFVFSISLFPSHYYMFFQVADVCQNERAESQNHK
jgi:hypothetical protein